MASQTRQETYHQQLVRIATVVGAYWVVSISMVFLNSFLLSSKSVKLDAPLFITFFQCVIGSLCLFLLSKLGSKVSFLDEFPAYSISVELMLKLLPLSMVFVAMIALNNLCLKYLGVAFYNVGRSLTTIFNVMFSFIILRQSTSARAIGCCGVIICGFLLGVNQEDQGKKATTAAVPDSRWQLFLGIIFGVSASATVSLNAIFTKKYLPIVDSNLWRLQIYNNLNACVLFIPLMLFFGELPIVFNYPGITSHFFWGMMVFSGVLGMAIAYVTGLQIKTTSPLTHNVSGTAKACFQTVLAVFFNSEFKSVLWWLSNVMVMAGSGLYTFVRQSEMRAAHDRTAADEISKASATSTGENGGSKV